MGILGKFGAAVLDMGVDIGGGQMRSVVPSIKILERDIKNLCLTPYP